MNAKRCWCGGILYNSIHEGYLQCQNCSTLVVKNQPSQNDLKKFYTFDDYWHNYVTGKFGYPSIEERAERDFRDRILIWFSILKKYKPEADSLLEIGCAHGGFLYFCKENGIKNVVGVEVDPKTCEFAREKFKLENIIPGLFPDVQLPLEKFDVIAGFDVLEHFTDPIKALKAIKKLLKDDGICIFQTPCYNGEGQDWLHFKPEEHLFLFNRQNIFLLFDKVGLDVFDILPGIIREDMFVIARHKKLVDKIQIEIPTDESSFKKFLNPMKIAIGLIEHMGDIVACEPVSRYLKSEYPDSHIVWCVREEYKELIDSNPYVDETLVVNCLTEWIYLKENGIFDKVVDLHIHNRICPICNVKLKNINGNTVVTGENYFYFGSLLSAFCRSAGIPVLDGKPNVYIPDTIVEKVNSLKLPEQYIVFHCTSNEKAKDWDERKWIELSKYIMKKYKIPIVEIGTNSVLGKSEIKFINLCGKTSILESAEVIKRAMLFIGVDSGPAHLANAVETPGIILLGHYRNFKRYIPFTGGYADEENARLIYNDFGPAYEIPLEKVIESADEFLNEKLRKSFEQISTENKLNPEKKAKVIAFFLPQFHPIPENDKWWGKGFTEWRNVVMAKPLFPGHYQPHIPADTGFYDLRLPEIRKLQAELANQYGIEAFCYWHYWFNGKLLLERPIVEILESGEPDFPFCFAWANENWTRRWDGLNNEILIEQTYGGIKDHIEHFNWLLKFFKDPRYFKVDGKPIFLIYRPGQIPDLKDMIELWRRLARKSGLPDLFLIAIKASADAVLNWKTLGFDGELVFQPLFAGIVNYFQSKREMPHQEMDFIFEYDEAVELMSKFNEETLKQSKTSFACVVPSWDNTARRKKLKPFILTNSSSETFERWLRIEIERLRDRDPEYKIVFINAWNEWAEGNHLEPDLKFGYAYLEAVRRAVYGSSYFTIRHKTRKFYTIDDEITPDALLQFARKIYLEKDKGLAERYFNLSLRYTLKEMANSYHRYKLFNWTHKEEEAEKELQSFKILSSLASQIHNDIGVIKHSDDEIVESYLHLQLALLYDPNNLTAIKNLAELLIEQGYVEKAVELYQEILKRNPDDKDAIEAIAQIFKENDSLENQPVASIIIPVFNQIEYTKLAIESIRKYTNIPYEIIVIDNASTDGTFEYLSSLGDIKLIRNSQNYGFPKAINQGIAVAKGKYIVVLNNDVIVTDRWLERLIEHFKDDESIGIIGPVSNFVSGVQVLNGVEKIYSMNGVVDEKLLQNFANEIYMKNKGEKFLFPRIAGLCMVIKREVIEKIGGFDERFTPGNFEDDDYCLRANLAGFKVAIARDVFIHHFGSKSFKADGVKKYIELLKRNEKIFIKKWGATPREIFTRNKKPRICEIFIPIKTNTEIQNAQSKIIPVHDR